MKQKFRLLLWVVLLLCFAFTGCSKSEVYTKEFSLEKIYQTHDGSLSILPWFTTLEDAKEILEIDEIPEQDVKDDVSGEPGILQIENVKLKEFHYPMQLKLFFSKNVPYTDTQDYVLCGYDFTLNEVDGEALDHTMNPNKAERIFQQYEKDRVAWLKTADQKYKAKPDKIIPDHEDVYQKLSEKKDTHGYVEYAYSEEEESLMVRLTFNTCIIWAQIQF